jgi:hypothetical protein
MKLRWPRKLARACRRWLVAYLHSDPWLDRHFPRHNDPEPPGGYS